MKITDINLDEFDRQEYIHFVKTLLDYYYVQFGYILEIKEGE